MEHHEFLFARVFLLTVINTRLNVNLKRVLIQTRVTPKVAEALQKGARESRKPLSTYVRELLERQLLEQPRFKY